MQIKKQQSEPDMEQQIGFKLGKECIKAVHCHPTYSAYMQSTSCTVHHVHHVQYIMYLAWNARMDESQAVIKFSGRNINNLRYADETTFIAESKRN